MKKEKIELLAAHSVLGGLSYIMDTIFGIQYRTYPEAISKNTAYKSKIVEEA
ncbi:MAG: hypothetical protein PUB18_01225 [bacterium]|nr:hypothetical protein [bacterium]